MHLIIIFLKQWHCSERGRVIFFCSLLVEDYLFKYHNHIEHSTVPLRINALASIFFLETRTETLNGKDMKSHMNFYTFFIKSTE